MRFRILGLILLLLTLPFAAQVAVQASGQAQEIDRVADAENLVRTLLDGDYAAVYERFNDQVKGLVSQDQLQQAMEGIVGQAGAFEEIENVRETDSAVIVTVRFELITLDAHVGFDADGAVSALTFAAAQNDQPTPTPAFATPTYVSPDQVIETEVVVGEFDLPGLIAAPNTTDLVPAVVLLSGSGPNDRDETIQQVKPFRDIAWGLAAQGIATLRFDKRTFAARDSLDTESFTLDQEYTEDALAAVDLLRRTEGIDPDRVYVLGHSLGGYALPRVAAANPEGIAGIIVMAGLANPLPETIVEQTRYLLSLGSQTPEQQEASIVPVQELVDQINAMDENTPADQVVLGAAPAYWIDLRDYDPVALAQTLDEPMLILQGERDYQVTGERDLVRWQEALGEREDVTIISYPDLNHLFMAGEGMSTPQEYAQPGNVDQQVIEDIAAWVMGQ